MRKSILGSFDGVNKKDEAYDIQYIYYKDIVPMKKNRELRNVEELAEDIFEDGLEAPLIVNEMKDSDKYMIIAGHRRYTAICMNIEKGDLKYEKIPCHVKTYAEDDATRRKILNNIQTDGYTPGEMLGVIEELKDVYQRKKEQGDKIPGRIRNLLAEDVGLKPSQVGNYEKVLNNGSEEVKELVKNEEIPLNVAVELVDLPHEEQVMFVEANDEIDLKTVKEYKEEVSLDQGEDFQEEDLLEDNCYDEVKDEEQISEFSKEEESNASFGMTEVLEELKNIQKSCGLLMEKVSYAELDDKVIAVSENKQVEITLNKILQVIYTNINKSHDVIEKLIKD